MLTGWQPPFKVERDLTREECDGELRHDASVENSADDAISLVRFNSVFIEYVDRTFKIKGMIATLVSLTLSCVTVFGVFALIVKASEMRGGLADSAFSVSSVALAGAGMIALIWFVYLHKDMFSYTHYPVRFNRITRKIYFFRHNGPGGVVAVPWGSPFAFFHIGRGGQDPNLRDLRCHLLDRNRQVQQTFTIGHFWDHDQDIREQWTLICRYMQEGPETCFDDPLDRVITLSTLPTFRNHWMLVCLMMGTNLFPFRHNLLFPFYAALTLSRWLTFKTCKAPVFPPEIEAECVIAPDDPYALPEPRFMAEFASDPAIYERARKRHLEKIMWR